jgi:hypothetical protein
MGRAVIVAYRPLAGMEWRLLELVKEHVHVLRQENLATERQPWVLRAGDGTILEVFEWNSDTAIERAHALPAIQALWARFAEACEYVKLADLAEARDLFATFDPIGE